MNIDGIGKLYTQSFIFQKFHFQFHSYFEWYEKDKNPFFEFCNRAYQRKSWYYSDVFMVLWFGIHLIVQFIIIANSTKITIEDTSVDREDQILAADFFSYSEYNFDWFWCISIKIFIPTYNHLLGYVISEKTFPEFLYGSFWNILFEYDRAFLLCQCYFLKK